MPRVLQEAREDNHRQTRLPGSDYGSIEQNTDGGVLELSSLCALNLP